MGNQLTQNDKLIIIEEKIRDYPDFPKKGIIFRDIMPVFDDPRTLTLLIEVICDKIKDYQFDRIMGIESRGFLIGPLLANKLKLPFSPIRKKGKLPGELYSIDYDLEYGKDTLQIQKCGLPSYSRCLLVDDLIATGGSMCAAKLLIENANSEVIACLALIELTDLDGAQKLGDCPLINLFSY